MRLENLVMQARDPIVTGRFWRDALGLEERTAERELYEARLDLGEGVWFDVCVERVDGPPVPGQRLHPDLLGGARQQEVVDRLLGLGARHLDLGQGPVPWVILADPDGNPFCVMEERPAYRGTGPIAALPLDCADPDREAPLWMAMTGWERAEGVGAVSLRHPAGRGPLLELCGEEGAKPAGAQNRMHLDVRPTADGPTQAEAVELALALGATRAEEPWAQGHGWVVLRDGSGNEFCILADDHTGGDVPSGG